MVEKMVKRNSLPQKPQQGVKHYTDQQRACVKSTAENFDCVQSQRKIRKLFILPFKRFSMNECNFFVCLKSLVVIWIYDQ
jgi:hypothetical protein